MTCATSLPSARTGYEAQQTDQPADPDRLVNLWEPVDGRGGRDVGAHGAFDDEAVNRSLQAWVGNVLASRWPAVDYLPAFWLWGCGADSPDVLAQSVGRSDPGSSSCLDTATLRGVPVPSGPRTSREVT